MSLLQPGNPINVLAAAAAAASATATASPKRDPDRDQAAQLCGDDSSSGSAEHSTETLTQEATTQKTANAGFRFLSRMMVLSRRNSGDLPMQMRLQRFDSLHDARLRFGAVSMPPLS